MSQNQDICKLILQMKTNISMLYVLKQNKKCCMAQLNDLNKKLVGLKFKKTLPNPKIDKKEFIRRKKNH